MNAKDIIREQISASAEIKQQLLSDNRVCDVIAKAAQICVEAYRNGKKTLFAGNGGSAADAQHLAGEFVSKFYFDRPGLPSIALTTDTSILTAIGNDYGYDRLFARQVQAQGNEGACFHWNIHIRKFPRISLRHYQNVTVRGFSTIALTGSKPCKMDDFDLVIKVPSDSPPLYSGMSDFDWPYNLLYCGTGNIR